MRERDWRILLTGGNMQGQAEIGAEKPSEHTLDKLTDERGIGVP